MGHHTSANPEGQAFGAFTKTSAKQHNRHLEVMGHHASANPEGQAFGAFTKTFVKQHNRHNPRSDTSKKCDHCKKERHTKDECWFLHPELRPQGQRRRRDVNEGEIKWKRGFLAEAGGRVGKKDRDRANLLDHSPRIRCSS
jgi:hypothetical protein